MSDNTQFSTQKQDDRLPPVGRLNSLGEHADRADAKALLAVLQAAGEIQHRHSTGARHTAREALWDFWEMPRLPRPLVNSKYPKAYPWSPAARAVYHRNPKRPQGGWGLILEHLAPRGLLVKEMLEESENASLDVQNLIEKLSHRLIATVVTKADDHRLSAAGLSGTLPTNADPEDLWARYKEAGLDPREFSSVL